MRRLVAIVWLMLSASACQPLPQPFADDRPPPLASILTLKDSAGVLVRPVAGAPEPAADALAEAMADALRKAEVPANTVAGNRRSWVLAGTAAARPAGPGRRAVELRWELRDADGHPAGAELARAELSDDAWSQGMPDAVQRLVAPAVAKLAAMVQDEAPVAASLDQGPAVFVRDVAGAPGDGPLALRRAMVAALRQQRVATASGPASGKEFVVAGKVDLGPVRDGKQPIKVSWSVETPDGTQVGLVNQENAVPAGSLDRAWGDVAFIVATAAADGVVALLEKARALPPRRS